jgi:exopolysaccharide biosynthesis polyprenyl glycosylphosphotransferase
MLREHRELIKKIYAGLELLCILAAWGGAYLLLSLAGTVLDRFSSYSLPFFVFSLSVIGSLSVRKFRPEEHLSSPLQVVREVSYAVVSGVFFVIFVFYLFKLRHMSRLFLFTSCALSLVFLWVWNLFINLFYRKIREKGLNYQHLLLVGNDYTLPPVIGSVQSNPSLGQKIEAVLLMEGEGAPKEFEGLKVYREISKITDILDRNVIDNVLFTVYRQQPLEIEKAMLACQERGIKVWLKLDFMHGALISRVDYLADIALFVFSLGPKAGLRLAMKRLFDVLASAILLALLVVPMAAVVLFVKTTPGPIFFVQKRVGLNGRRFMMTKFRTMYKDAEQRRAEYNLKNEMKGPVFKMKNDPRITPVGRFLRKYSLDELPQIWSVLTGDMSLVGPRPPLPAEVDLYQGWQRRRLSMRPGITCIWQVTGRNKITDFNEWARLDLEYIDKWSLSGDLKILLKTIPAVIKGTGL